MVHDSYSKLRVGWICILAMIFLIASGCAGNLENVITQTYSVTSKVQSFRFSGERRFLDVATGTVSILSIEGACVLPNSSHMRAICESTSKTGWQTFEAIIVDGIEHERHDDYNWSIGTWTRELKPPKPTEYLKSLTDIHELPDAVINGVTCLHLKGMADLGHKHWSTGGIQGSKEMPKMVSSLIDKIREGVQTQVEVWIGKEDYLLRRVQFHLQFLKEPMEVFSKDAPVTISETIDLYDYNQPIEIEPPSL